MTNHGNQSRITKALKYQKLIADCTSEQKKKEFISKIEKYQRRLADINVKNRNQITIQTNTSKFLKDNSHLKRKYKSFLHSDTPNAIMTGPTQSKKTDGIYDIIKECWKTNFSAIVSTDNRTDQLFQIFTRLKKMTEQDDIVLINTTSKKWEDQFDDCIEYNKMFVLFCLDNVSSIKKVKRSMRALRGKKYNLCIIHDEADVINKHSEVNEIQEGQPKSHQEWILMINDLENYVVTKRIFVTATPHNCMHLHNIKTDVIWQLEPPVDYQGFNDISYNTIDEDQKDEYMKQEILRIQRETEQGKGGEIILEVYDKKIELGQANCFKKRIEMFPDITIDTYNGKGISYYSKNKRIEELLKLNNVQFTIVGDDVGVDVIMIKQKDLSIQNFYEFCQQAEEKVVLTIGYDLIQRSISFVSSCRTTKYPLAATTMFYHPGKKCNVVNVIQGIGRICGTARPDLKPRLYSSQQIIKDYKQANEDFVKYLKNCRENVDDTKNTNDIMEETSFGKLNRKVDRPALKLEHVYRANFEYDHTNSKALNTATKHRNSDLLIGRMLRFLYSEEKPVSFQEFKLGVNYDRSDSCYHNYLLNGASMGGNFGHLWIEDDNNSYILHPLVRLHMDELDIE